MSMQTELDGVYSHFQANAPEFVKTTVVQAKTDFTRSFDPKTTIQVGSKLPPFELPDAKLGTVSSADLLAKGPILLTFYRGGWCPFCNVALQHLQRRLAEFQAKGVMLVAISPELPDSTLSTAEKNALAFPVLTDLHNAYAHQLGIVWKQPRSMEKVFEAFGNDLKTRNGDDSLEVPVPSTFLVDKNGVIRNAHVEADYTKRLDPATALEWIDALQKAD